MYGNMDRVDELSLMGKNVSCWGKAVSNTLKKCLHYSMLKKCVIPREAFFFPAIYCRRFVSIEYARKICLFDSALSEYFVYCGLLAVLTSGVAFFFFWHINVATGRFITVVDVCGCAVYVTLLQVLQSYYHSSINRRCLTRESCRTTAGCVGVVTERRLRHC